MIRLDERFDLVIGKAASADRQQASLLRAFFRQSIARRCAGSPHVREVTLEGSSARHQTDGSVYLALAALVPRENVVVFDVEALIDRAGTATYALLTPTSLDSVFRPRGGSAAARLSRVLALETALRSCRLVVVFDARQARAVATLGAPDVVMLPLPAMASPAEPMAAQGGLLIVSHDVADDVAPSVASMVQVAARDLRITLVSSAERHSISPAVLTDAANAEIHIHIGYAREPVAPLRIIDSFAARKPVIHLAMGKPPLFPDELTRMQMIVEPFRSGLVAHSATELVAFLQQIRGDAAMRDIFRRNVDQAAGAFNQVIEQGLWEKLA